MQTVKTRGEGEKSQQNFEMNSSLIFMTAADMHQFRVLRPPDLTPFEKLWTSLNFPIFLP
jgi:hypothetical protein